jgi:MerR family transcriptional regulator, light-induced transcriptional regulator
MSSPNAMQWTAAAVAARIGVATTTLRTWSRRYGVGPVDHVPGRHRRYTAADVSQLETFCALMADGVAPAAAAQHVHGNAVRGDVRGSAEHAGRDSGDGPRPPRLGGSAAVRGLLSAVLRLDADTVARTVEQSIAAAGVVSAWDLLCVPALVEVGRRNETGGICIDAEHLLSAILSAALHRVTGPAPPTAGRGALLSCTPRERHTLALEALHAALTERAAPVRNLGADLPSGALLDAVRRTRPAAVALWAQTERTARVGQLAQLHSLGSTVVVAVGPGWAQRRLPHGVITANTLTAAINALRPPDARAGSGLA